MNREHSLLLTIVASLVLLGLASAGSAEAATTPTKPLTPLEQTVLNSEKNFLAAVKKGDPAFLKRTFTDDYFFVGFDGEVADREETIEMLGDGGLDIRPYNFKVVTEGDSTAIVTYDVVLQVPPSEDEGPPPRYQHFTSLWVKRAGEWKLKFQQATPSHWGDW
ncbi:MAG: nuclear transport factor 2 family protein [Candidatus Sulfotelmatobacter sp.]